MNKHLVFFGFLFFSILCSAQDILILSNGNKLNCKVLLIDNNRVHFTIEGNEIATSIPKSAVRDILYGTSPITKSANSVDKDEQKLKNSITIGLLEGGGSLIGFDYETMFSKFAGIQIGAGFVGFGGGLNVHFKPTIRSSYLSIQYWHQGIRSSFAQSLLGPGYVFRSKKWFTCQIGLGFELEKGPAWPENAPETPVMLTYAIGGYFPW